MEHKLDLTKFSAVVRDPLTTAVIADCNGTMAPFQDDPDAVAVPPDMREACAAAAEVFGHMAVVSSQTTDWLVRRFDVGDMLYFGEQGAEVVYRGQTLWRNDEFARRARELAEFVAGLRRWLHTANVEIQKQGSIWSLHLKRVAPDRRSDVIAGVRSAAASERFPVTEQYDVIDLMPAAGANKGIAGLMLLMGTVPGGPLAAAAPTLPITQVAWAGDDVSDAAAWVEVGEDVDLYRIGVLHDGRPVPQIEDLADTTVDGVAGWCTHLQHLAARAHRRL